MGIVNVVGVGYQGHSVDEVCAKLIADGVGLVCDVRLTPLSRKTGLSKTALSSALGAAGLDYLHFPALGNPKWNRAGFASTDTELYLAQQTFTITVLASPEARHAIDEIRERACEQKAALLCFESDESRCHRSLIIADILRADQFLTSVSYPFYSFG